LADDADERLGRFAATAVAPEPHVQLTAAPLLVAISPGGIS
jgi:hypothetical protein